METEKSKVYIQIDWDNHVTAVDGGYTIANIDNFDEWIFVDEGTGDRYNLCQTHYCPGGLVNEDGTYRYRYRDGKVELILYEGK